MREDAVTLEVVADEGELLAVALLPGEEDSRVRAGCVVGACDPEVTAAGRHRRDGVLVSPSRSASHGPSMPPYSNVSSNDKHIMKPFE